MKKLNITKYIFVGCFALIASAAMPQMASAQKVVIGTYEFPKDKAVYYGELEGGKPEGKGKTTFKTGDVYEG